MYIRNVPAYKTNVFISNLWQETLRGRKWMVVCEDTNHGYKWERETERERGRYVGACPRGRPLQMGARNGEGAREKK